ncbi:MAG TPA: hypothetical protein VEM14_07145 [Gemmatimonadaceae bacterium]|nr:hypothetical protein [Gemmatimonadaceae bacterium]
MSGTHDTVVMEVANAKAPDKACTGHEKIHQPFHLRSAHAQFTAVSGLPHQFYSGPK